jgi:hypothetical protein
MKAKIFDRKFDAGEKVIDQLDLAKARRVGTAPKRVNVDFPSWMVQSIDREANRLGVTRQSLIKMWLADRLARARSPHSAE